MIKQIFRSKIGLILISIIVVITLNVVTAIFFIYSFGDSSSNLSRATSNDLFSSESPFFIRSESIEALDVFEDEVIPNLGKLDNCNNTTVEEFRSADQPYNLNIVNIQCIEDLFQLNKSARAILKNSKAVMINKPSVGEVELRIVLESKVKKDYRIEHAITNYEIQSDSIHSRVIKYSDSCFYSILIY